MRTGDFMQDSKAFDKMTDEVMTSVHAIETIIARHGLAVIHRAPGVGVPARSYTVGLAALHLPELIVYGLDKSIAEYVLNNIATRLRSGADVVDKARLEDVLEFYPVMVRELSLAAATPEMGAARMFTKGKPWRALQVFWPDAEGRFPGERNCDRSCASSQPRLGTRSLLRTAMRK
jgi:hypothetical protein